MSAVVLFVLLLLAPLLEETVFRRGVHAWALRHWGRATTRWWAWPSPVNVGVALLFAAAHLLRLPPLLALAVVLPALVVGQMYELTGRLWPCVATHATFNLVWLGLTAGLPA
jgi:membrane protease YdiL (CAAX protease family)